MSAKEAIFYLIFPVYQLPKNAHHKIVRFVIEKEKENVKFNRKGHWSMEGVLTGTRNRMRTRI